MLFNRGLDPTNRATVRIRVPKARLRMLTATGARTPPTRGIAVPSRV